ncbi:hypothetical protein V8E54_002107 [Elaphomyces granulatus]
MEKSRQETFKRLRPPCIELSSVALKFRAQQNSSDDVLKALDVVYTELKVISTKDVLDEKLAEYVFFPLSQIFNETQRLSLRTLELAVICLRILIEKGWRQHLSPQMGKQLLILLTLLIGGTPAQNKGEQSAKPKSEELAVAVFECQTALFKALEGPVAEQTIFNEIGTSTIIDRSVYLLLESISGESSDTIQRAAVAACQALFTRITDRVVLASILPRTVSALTKTLRPTTQTRRSYRLLQRCLLLLTQTLRTVLNDDDAQGPVQGSNDRIVLDESWLKATAAQIKIALANVIQLRRHDRREVQNALLALCLMIITQCSKSLEDSLVMMVETVIVLSEFDDNHTANDAYSELRRIATTYTYVIDAVKDLLHTWVMSFPRTMQGNDETSKQRAIRQISTAFHVLSDTQSSSDILNNKLAFGLCDSVAVVFDSMRAIPQQMSAVGESELQLSVPHQGKKSHQFPPVLFDHRSQQQTLRDLQSMIIQLNLTDSAVAITRFIVSRIHSNSGDTLVAPLWLAMNFLKSVSRASSTFEDFISSEHTEAMPLSSSRVMMVEELYSTCLPILNESPATMKRDWRTIALGLEAIALQAQQLGEGFRMELIDALYPVLQYLASNNPSLQTHAMTCLNILTTACNYPDTSSMLIENVDYLVNSVALKLNTFDISPHPPQVLLMMIRLCKANLNPYLDDLVDSIFGILDMHHGYPKLVELLFSVLGAIVEEGVRSPALLAITNDAGSDVINHRKRQYQPITIASVANGFVQRRAKRAPHLEAVSNIDGEKSPYPKRPWTMKLDGLPQAKDDTEPIPDSHDEGESNGPLTNPREAEDSERPLSKPHTLLLHILRSIPSHLSSPSPFLRRSLLSLLSQAFPVLSQNENSFLPLLNDLWPSVSSRITFPPSFAPDITASFTSSSSALVNRESDRKVDDAEIKEEVFVIVAACTAVATMCTCAGDFMASRVENEFPRWRRIYHQAWEKVRADAEKILERRVQHLPTGSGGSTQAYGRGLSLARKYSEGLDLSLGLGLSSSLTEGSRLFTPHHALWRGLTTLFISVLTHVRLPLAIGDEICELLGSWITRFTASEYFTARIRKRLHEIPSAEEMEDLQQSSDSTREGQAVEHAIQAMETWNKDLTWFILQQQDKVAIAPTSRLPRVASKGNVGFAEVIF